MTLTRTEALFFLLQRDHPGVPLHAILDRLPTIRPEQDETAAQEAKRLAKRLREEPR